MAVHEEETSVGAEFCWKVLIIQTRPCSLREAISEVECFGSSRIVIKKH